MKKIKSNDVLNTLAAIQAYQRQRLVPVPRNFSTVIPSSSGNFYSGAAITPTSNDFLGDWRTADGWMRFDMLRVRMRSRQLERGNPWCQSFQKALLNNVVGHFGFRCRPNVINSLAFEDFTDGTEDKEANAKIIAFRKLCSKKENMTTRKRLDEIDLDRLIVNRVCWDGEIFIRKIRKFDNEVGFAWQVIDPDYCDQHMNRTLPNGNLIKMGVELEKDYKFPVAYWFRKRRPNDDFYPAEQIDPELYYRVPAEEIIHIYVQSMDPEQTRGWPWLFAACVNLFRLGKFEEAALINATIGASKQGFFKKIAPDGFTEQWDDLSDEDEGEVIDEVTPGSWTELPWNVEPVMVDFKYPDEKLGEFEKVMLRSISACAGSSYMSLTGDVSDANFSNVRAGQGNEREEWMTLQGFFIRNWKMPQYEETVYRGILNQRLKLPFGKLDKFSASTIFIGRRWDYVNPVDDLRGKKMELEIGITSVTQIIEDKGGDPDVVFAAIKKDMDRFDSLGIAHPFGVEHKTSETDTDNQPSEAAMEKSKKPVKKS